MAFGKRPVSWYYHNLVDGPATGLPHYTAVFVGDDFDPTAETLVLQKEQQQQRPYLRSAGAVPVKQVPTDRETGPAEELMDLNLLVGQ